VPSERGFREGDTEGNPRPEIGSVSAVPPVVQHEAAGISPLPFLLIPLTPGMLLLGPSALAETCDERTLPLSLLTG
jgi:hypothetical protein